MQQRPGGLSTNAFSPAQARIARRETRLGPESTRPSRSTSTLSASSWPPARRAFRVAWCPARRVLASPGGEQPVTRSQVEPVRSRVTVVKVRDVTIRHRVIAGECEPREIALVLLTGGRHPNMLLTVRIRRDQT